MSDEWQPLGVREGWVTDYDALHYGVPDWLRSSLVAWVESRLTRAGNVREARVQEVERVLRTPLPWSEGSWKAFKAITSWATSAPDRFLQAVDLLLARLSRPTEDAVAIRLEEALASGGSAWRVAERNGVIGLEKRVEKTIQAAAETAMSGDLPAAKLLSEAWREMYGQNPDASEAYRHAVKAVEAAAKPVVTPNDPTATLGKMIAAMRNAPHKWSFAIKGQGDAGVQGVRHLMELVWKGQYDRHGDPDPDRPLEVEPEEAEAALHAAVTLVHWFRSGAVRRRE